MISKFTLLCRITLGISLLLLPSAIFATSASQSLVDVPVPFGTRLQSVGDNVVHNGQSIAVATFESSLPLVDTVDFYHQLWTEEPGTQLPGLVENRAGEWLMLGRLQDGLQIVLQLRSAEEHRSTGYLSVMNIDTVASDTRSGTPLPGLERLSTTLSEDAGRASTLSVYSSRESVESMSHQLADLWQGKGWTLVSSEVYAQSRVMLLNRDTAQLEIVVSHEAGEQTIIVMNEVVDRD